MSDKTNQPHPEIPRRGIACPRCGCGGPHEVYYTRQERGFTKRVRTCRYCGKRFSTRERTT